MSKYDFELKDVCDEDYDFDDHSNNIDSEYLNEDRNEREKNKNVKIYTNPILDNGLTLNEQVLEFQEYDAMIEDEVEYFIKCKRDDAFESVLNYYKSYEFLWWNKCKISFANFDDFKSFFYDVMLYCMRKFDVNKTIDKVYKTDFRKSNKGINNFNGMFFSYLNYRRDNHFQKDMNVNKNPSVRCEICDRNVVSISDYHLQHNYTLPLIKKEFKVEPAKSKDKKKFFEKCPICEQKDVSVDHVKSHTYAESIDLNEYVSRFPNAFLSGRTLSLNKEIGTHKDGAKVFTLEDVYEINCKDENSDLNYNEFVEHLEHVLEDRDLMVSILKCKMQFNASVKDIAKMIGETYRLRLNKAEGKRIRNKTDLIYFINSNDISDGYFKKYGNKIDIVDREETKDDTTLILSTVSKTQVAGELNKFKANHENILERVFGKKTVECLAV